MSNNLLHDIEMQAKTIEQLMTRCEVLDGAWATANKHREDLQAELVALKVDWKVYRDACAKQDDEIGELRRYNAAILDQNESLSLERDALSVKVTELKLDIASIAATLDITLNAGVVSSELELVECQAENERLRAALEKILEYDKFFVLWNHEQAMHDIAREALEVTK